MKILVRCIGGPEAGREWQFDGSGTITLGRESGSMIKTPESEQTISRRHCIISVQPPAVYVADAGSAHGTWVNGRMIGRQGQGEQMPISSGAVIGVGKNGSAARFEIRIAGSGGGQVGYDPNYGRGPAAGTQGYGGGGQLGYNVPQGGSYGQEMSFIRRLGGIYKDPSGQARGIAASNKASTGSLLICIYLAATLVMCLFVVLGVQSRIGYVGNYLASYAGVNWGMPVIYIVIASAINYFGLAGLLLLSSHVFFGAKTSFAGMAGITGIKGIWEGSFMLVFGLFFLISPEVGATFGLLIYAVGILFSWMLLLFCYADIVPLSPNKKFYSAFIAVIGSMLLDLLVYGLFLGSAISNLSRISSYW